MLKLTSLFAAMLFSIFAIAPAAADEPKYEAGHVWEFEAPGVKPGALLVIQQVDSAELDDLPSDIYHISIVAELNEGEPNQLQLAHLPVSQETLDKSVTKRSEVKLVFSGWLQGWDQWRKAKGGVFTVSIGNIIQMLVGQSSEV